MPSTRWAFPSRARRTRGTERSATGRSTSVGESRCAGPRRLRRASWAEPVSPASSRRLATPPARHVLPTDSARRSARWSAAIALSERRLMQAREAARSVTWALREPPPQAAARPALREPSARCRALRSVRPALRVQRVTPAPPPALSARLAGSRRCRARRRAHRVRLERSPRPRVRSRAPIVRPAPSQQMRAHRRAPRVRLVHSPPRPARRSVRPALRAPSRARRALWGAPRVLPAACRPTREQRAARSAQPVSSRRSRGCRRAAPARQARSR